MPVTIEDIAKSASDWSIEVTPAGAIKIESFAGILEEGTTVNVTFLPGSDPLDTIATAKRLADDGMNAVPHIAARSLQNKEQLDDLLKRMTSEANVREVLVIGGGVDNPVGEFDCTMQILQTGLIQKYGITHIGVSGHPEGSPDISADQLAQAISQKNEFARKEGLSLYMETQFCFDPAAVLAWEKTIRQAGNQLPIRIGIPGPATIKTLFRFAQISGIGPSMRFIAKQARNVAKLMTVQSPHELLAGLAEGMAADNKCLLQHFHYYPFGGFAKTAAYAKAVEQGNIRLLPKGGFEVQDA
ncbi:MAG: metFprotein [Proteobacteria bacterium]|nr:metFprotein [Pseudomonadota bacterium]